MSVELQTRLDSVFKDYAGLLEGLPREARFSLQESAGVEIGLLKMGLQIDDFRCVRAN